MKSLEKTRRPPFPFCPIRWRSLFDVMPPKKKKQATAKSKAASTKKKKDVKDAPKSGVALSSKSWTLSGGLAALPLELLQHVFKFLVLDSTRFMVIGWLTATNAEFQPLQPWRVAKYGKHELSRDFFVSCSFSSFYSLFSAFYLLLKPSIPGLLNLRPFSMTYHYSA
jgi:hypothetical protein